MKRILSLLLAFVFLQAETWAIGGGPAGLGSARAISGTYAGVLLPKSSTAGGLVILDANALGIFSIGIPTTGIATGTAAFFTSGEVFTGKMSGVANPLKGTLSALMEASTIRIITVEVGAGSAVGAFGSDVRTVGSLKARIDQGQSGIQRLKGTASLNSFSDAKRNADGTVLIRGQISFFVDGFKQSDASTTPAQINFNINVNSATP